MVSDHGMTIIEPYSKGFPDAILDGHSPYIAVLFVYFVCIMIGYEWSRDHSLAICPAGFEWLAILPSLTRRGNKDDSISMFVRGFKNIIEH